MRKLIILAALSISHFGFSQLSEKLELLNIYDLEFVSDPQISPDGSQIMYVRNFKDVMTDRNLSNLWIVNFDGSNNRPITTGNQNDFQPRWAKDGKRILYKSNKDESTQIYLRWLDTGSETKITNTQKTPGNYTFSPDGQQIAFTLFVPESPTPVIKMPKKPEGAQWNDPPKYIDDMRYRADGQGYLKSGFNQIFIAPVDGGTPRQLTFEQANMGTPVWSKDGTSLLFSANLHDNSDYDPRNSEIYQVNIAGGNIRALTNRQGPDFSPIPSPDGKKIAYLGFDDRYQGYQVTRLYTMNADGTGSKLISGNLDRDVQNISWSGDGKGIYFQYNDKGDTKIALMSLGGKVNDLTNMVGGLSLGRPYSGGTFTITPNGRYAYTLGASDHPAELGSGSNGNAKRLTNLNDDLFKYTPPGRVEEIWYKSSFDQRDIQGWIVYPPDFDATKKYPLILEIHGGPFASYSPFFSMEVQLFASAGNIVFYANPRGSTSYGEEFGNLIHHNYPSQDYDDLMSGVDAVIAKGNVDEDNLFVTGGSGGGVLTSWIVGKTDRFRAAVVAKPVINWYSFVLYADNPGFFYKYWFPGLPWEHEEHYMKRSPISLVGNVKTPTMLLTGEDDYRTPISETEQYYAALKLQKVETAMVRIPGASHGIAAKPSNLVAKVASILTWFDKYKGEELKGKIEGRE